MSILSRYTKAFNFIQNFKTQCLPENLAKSLPREITHTSGQYAKLLAIAYRNVVQGLSSKDPLGSIGLLEEHRITSLEQFFGQNGYLLSAVANLCAFLERHAVKAGTRAKEMIEKPIKFLNDLGMELAVAANPSRAKPGEIFHDSFVILAQHVQHAVLRSTTVISGILDLKKKIS